MLISKLGLFLLALAFATLCAFCISATLKKIGKGSDGVGCVSGFLLTFAFWMLLMFITPEVIIVTGSAGKLDQRESYSLFSYEGHSLELFKKYLDNQSSERLIIYPQFYTSSNEEDKAYKSNNKDIAVIGPSSFVVINHIPDHYFYTPSSVRSKYSGKIQTEWIIEEYSKLENEYNSEQDRRKEFLNEFILNTK